MRASTFSDPRSENATGALTPLGRRSCRGRCLRCGLMAGAAREPVPGWVRVLVIDRDRGRCRYCGAVPAGPRRRQLDHVHPVFRGGQGDLANLVLACSTCNSAKSSRVDVVPMPLAELIDIDEGRAPQRPPLRRSKGTRDLPRDQLQEWAAAGQRLHSAARRRLTDRYPLGSLTRCDICHEEFLVGITGQLDPARATLICFSCAQDRTTSTESRPRRSTIDPDAGTDSQPFAGPVTGCPSPEEVLAARTPAGGWSRATLHSWGVTWPPPKGWRTALLTQWREFAGHDDSSEL